MPDTKNVTKQVQSVSPYNPSTNSSLLQNNVDSSLNGTASTSQSIQDVSLGTTDFEQMNQSQKQDGFFVSKTDKLPIYDIPQSVKEYNRIKQLEVGVGVPYSFLNDTAALAKYDRVRKDFLVQNKSFSLDSYSSTEKIKAIINERDSIYKNKVDKIGNPFNVATSPRMFSGNRGVTADLRKDYSAATDAYSVIITESRTGTRSYDEINQGGEFSKLENTYGEGDSEQIVTICVLSNVQNFSFGTVQNFDEIEPRGAQSPLRFYKGNPGRTLNFTAEFYQQEYPKEPLLNIAEKAQYLCRPYRHGDYSVIPKLVKVDIPGRTFRGYLTSASVTYSYDMGDYRNWDREKVSAVIDNPNVSFANYNLSMIDTHPTGLVGGNYNSAETMDYGLGKMTIDFNLLIVEEVHLTLYESYAEKAAKEKQEIANRINEEIEKYKEDLRLYRETYPDALKGFSDEELILVDQETGAFVGFVFDQSSPTGEFLYNSSKDYPKGTVTLAEFSSTNNIEINGSNKESSNADLFKTNQAVYDAMGSQTKSEIVDALVKLDGDKYKKEDLEKMSIYEITNIRDQEIIDRSVDSGQMVDIVNDFAIETQQDVKGELVYKDTNVLDKSQFTKLRELLMKSPYDSSSIDDLISFVKEYGIHHPLVDNEYYGICFSSKRSNNILTYNYSRLLNYEVVVNNYGVVFKDNKPYMDFNNIPDSVLPKSYRDIFVEKCKSSDGLIPVAIITYGDFKNLLFLKDDTDTTLVKFFIHFYKAIIQNNKTFYQDAVSWAKGIFQTDNYFPDESWGRKIYAVGGTSQVENFVYICGTNCVYPGGR